MVGETRLEYLHHARGPGPGGPGSPAVASWVRTLTVAGTGTWWAGVWAGSRWQLNMAAVSAVSHLQPDKEGAVTAVRVAVIEMRKGRGLAMTGQNRL